MAGMVDADIKLQEVSKTMPKLVTDLIAYLKAVFVETWNIVFTLFDVLGIVLFFFPTLANSLVSNEALVRTIGGLIFFSSFLLANFTLYIKLVEESSYKADLRLEVLEKGFHHSYGTRRSPFHEVKENPGGFDKQGLPDWGSLWANIRVANVGFEKGQLIWELDKAKTKLPPLFDSGRISIEFHPPISVAGRSSSRADLFFDALFTEHDPHTFAQSLGALVKSKQRYQVVLRYRTSRVDGESETRELHIKGDFQDLYQKVFEYWEDYGFSDLADAARSAA